MQIMDIFVSGYGKFDIDNDILFESLNFEKKTLNEVSKKMFYQFLLVVLEHHLKRQTYQINIPHHYNFFITKKVLKNINAK